MLWFVVDLVLSRWLLCACCGFAIGIYLLLAVVGGVLWYCGCLVLVEFMVALFNSVDLSFSFFVCVYMFVAWFCSWLLLLGWFDCYCLLIACLPGSVGCCFGICCCLMVDLSARYGMWACWVYLVVMGCCWSCWSGLDLGFVLGGYNGLLCTGVWFVWLW